jgi:hypothetical protein
MWSVLPKKPRVLTLISGMPKLLYVMYTSSWNYQMLPAEQILACQTAWVALPPSPRPSW